MHSFPDTERGECLPGKEEQEEPRQMTWKCTDIGEMEWKSMTIHGGERYEEEPSVPSQGL